MKVKFKISNRILSLVLAFIMVLGMMPMTAYAAADTGAYAPTRRENYINSDDFIFANGTAITIEEAPNGTRVWYMDGTTKKYVTNNGENGEDLSGWHIFVGSNNADGMRGVNGSITMTGGTVGYIYAGQYYGYFTGTSNITITGGTVKNSIFCDNYIGGITSDTIGTLTIFDATGATIKTGDVKADNVVQKKGTTWKVSGNGIIPTGVTLTVNEGEALTVPSGATLRNNGTLVNNGGTITVYGQLLGNAPENYVAPTDFTFTTATLNANVSTTLTTPTATPDNTTLVPWFTYEIADAGTTDAVINGETITPYGAGTVKVKVIMHDGYSTPIEKVYDFPVSFTAVTDISGNVPTECWVNRNNALPTSVTPSDASYRTVTWSVVDAGTTGAAISGNQLKATNSGTATIRATVANGNAYGSDFTKDYTVIFRATDTIDIGLGSVSISKKDDSTVTVTYAPFDGGSKDYFIDEPIVITGTSDSYSITVLSGNPYIVLDNINLSTSTARPFSINSGSAVTLELVGENTIKAMREAYDPAIRVHSPSTLMIDGEGSLTATGGSTAACIGDLGANTGNGPGTIIINGGTIVAGNRYGIGASNQGKTGTVIINGGNIKATKITGTLKDENGNSLSLNTITLNGATDGTTVTDIEGVEYGLKGVKTLGDKLYFYLPSGAEVTSITAGGAVYDCKVGQTYYPGHDYVDATCSLPQTCTRCGHTVGEALGHSYVDGVCTTCGIGEGDGIFYISTAEQLMMFANYVNAGNQSADAVLMADIDLTGYAWTPIGVTAMGETVTDGYTGNFDGNGHVIRNVTFATPTSAMAAGIFGTVQSGGTVKHLGVEKFTFDNNAYDHRAGGIAGQLLAGSTISDCYVVNSTVKASSRVVGGIVGMNKGTVENCYTYNMTLAGANNRFGGISGDYTGGTLENCYTNHSALASSQTGTNQNCEAGVSAERFASGEITYKLNGSKSDDELVWYQTIGADNYPKFVGSVVYYDSTNGYNNHVHNWTYTKDGNKITATCDATGCPNNGGGSVTLVVKDAYYTGSTIAATVTDSLTSGATYVITYDDGAETAPSGLGTHSATLTVYENGTEKASVSAEYKISYLPAPDSAYSIDNGYKNGDTYWFNDGAKITINAPEGYTISTTLGGTYGDSVSLTESDSKVIYLKKTSDGTMTDAISITETISFDKTAPTGKIAIESRGFWEKLLNKLTFGLFFKGDKVATVTTADTDGSGVAKIEYYLADEDLVDDDTLADADAIAKLETAIGDKWSKYDNEIPLAKNAKYVIYVKITDNVGNITYLSSEGIVLYSDAEADTESVLTTYKAGEDRDVTVVLNGNTIKSVAKGTTALTKDSDYTVSASGETITIKGTYLDTLNAGEYTFTVSYNPLGLEYVEATENDAPATTTFKVQIDKADGAVTNISDISKTYDGKEVSEPTYTSLSTGNATFEYKLKGAEDSTYTTEAPSEAGDYIVRVIVAVDNNYNEASDTAEFTIGKATLTNVSVEQDGELIYNKEGQSAKVQTAATAVNSQKVTFTYSTVEDGTYGTSVPAFTNAGEHIVYFKATAPNHKVYEGKFTVTIEKQTVTEPTIESKTYTGSALTADIANTDLYTVETNNGGIKKGNYPVVLQLKDADNYKWSTDITGESATVILGFVISASENSWNSKPAIDGWTYGQSAKTPTYEAKFGNDTVKVTYKGTANDGTTWNDTGAPTKAGTYKAIFTVDATDDYGSLTEEVGFIIAKAPVTVTADNAAKTYGDSDPAAFTWQVTKGNLIGSDALVVNISRVAGENADTYAIKVSQDENANPNYDITFVNGTFTINKAQLTVTAENESATYGDVVPNYSVKITGWKNGDTKDVLGGKLKFTCGYAQFSDKGSYTIKAEGYQADNYTFKYVDGTLTVDAKPITVTIANKSSVYGDSIVTLTADDNGGIVNNDTNVYKLTTTATNSSAVGKYDIIGETLDDNYDITFENKDNAYEITTRELTVTVKVANKQYDGLNTATITSATLNNVANDDAVTLVNGTATFTSVNAADGISIAFTDFALSGEADVLKNYTLTQPTGVKANITNGWNPAVNNEYTVSAPNSNGWLREDLVIIAGDGFELSRTNTADGTWSNTLDGTKEGADSTEQFYIRNTNTGAISELVTVNYKLDKNTESTTTTGKVSFDERNGWESFLNTISFGLFYKDEVTVKVEATDKLSEVESIEYYAVESASATALTLEQVQALADDAWTTMPADGVGVKVEDAKQFVYYIRITDKAGNMTYLSTNGAEYDTTLPAISGVEDGKTYYTTQVVTIEDKNLESVVLKSGDADAGTVTLDNGKFTLAGDVDTTYTITVTDKAGNVTTVVVTMKEIASVKETIKDITEDDVTSADKDSVQDVIDHVDELLKDDALTEDEKKDLEDIKTEAEKLIDKVEETDAADETEDINKVKDITSENVTTDDKEDLEKAKEDLEKALEDYKDNLTEDEKKAIQDEIDRIDDALDIIEKVESVEEQIDKLPNNITKDDADEVDAAKKAYDGLSDYEKTLIDPNTKKKLEAALKAVEELKSPQTGEIPDTGDNTNFMALFMMMFGSMAAFFGILFGAKKKKEEE